MSDERGGNGRESVGIRQGILQVDDGAVELVRLLGERVPRTFDHIAVRLE